MVQEKSPTDTETGEFLGARSPCIKLVGIPAGTTYCCSRTTGKHGSQTLTQRVSTSVGARAGGRRMDVVHVRCAGLDVHKKTVVACVSVPAAEEGWQREVRTFGTTTQALQ